MITHPILSAPNRLLMYVGVWILFGSLLAAVVAVGGEAPWEWAFAFALPVGILLGLQSLSLWYAVQVLPARETPPLRLALSWLGAGILSIAIWLTLAVMWARWWLPDEYAGLPLRSAPLLVFAGGIGLVVAVLGHYLLAAFEHSRTAERRALELQVLAREAELKSLRAQLDPHFLFNSLNSVAALIGSDVAAARRMCYLMATFFRKSLSLGREQSIALADEIALIETFLGIEFVRFGERLRARLDVADDTRALAVPPLVLQPLVENAIHHGVAHLVEGGEVQLRTRRRDSLLEIVVENPCDPDRPPSQGAGVGLDNVRSRIETLFGHTATVDVEATDRTFKVSILMPATPMSAR